MKSHSKVSSCAGRRIIIALVILNLVAGGRRSEGAPSAPESSSAPKAEAGSPTTPGYFKTSFQNESQFVVESIITDIAEMLYFARNHAVPKSIVVNAREAGGTSDAPIYGVTIQVGDAPAIQIKLNISGPIWSEAVYADLTSAIAKSLTLASPATAPGDDVSVLDKLADGLAKTIAQQDLQISTNLEKDFTNPALHEQAAALLGAFALRESPSAFYDIRLPLCRMTAHLVVARFLAGEHPPGMVGRVADCMLLSEMNNEIAAVEQIDHLDTTRKPVATWARVLRACNTRDFRPLDSATNVPGIEQVSWFTAYSKANNRGIAWNAVGKAVLSQPDFCRIAAGLGHGVEIGNIMLQIWLPLEVGETRGVYKVLHSRELQQKDLVTALNSEPDRCFVREADGGGRVRVIGWGLWALQLQHHLCQAIVGDFYQMHSMLGWPEQSYKFAQDCDQQFGGLRFYDYVRRLDCTNAATYRESTDKGWAFTVKYPQLTPLGWMVHLSGRVSFAEPYRPIANPHCNEWTLHNPLPGTAYNVDARTGLASFVGDGREIEKVFKVHEMAPYDIGICKYLGRWYTTNWTHEAAEATFGRLMPYSAVAAACIADSRSDEPKKYEELMEIAVKWDPSFYQNLADYQWNHGETNQAMKTYEKQEQFDPDAVSLANLAGKRVKYYLATGQKKKAKEVADFAGEVYSGAGLAAKAMYLEQTGDLTNAFEWYSKIEERYSGNADELLFFCCRHVSAKGDAALDWLIDARLKKWYNERDKVTLSDFSKPPKSGVSITKAGPLLEKNGLKNKDVIVAARGVRIYNMTQLFFARDMDAGPELKLIYWQGSEYREVTITLNAEHRVGAELMNFWVK